MLVLIKPVEIWIEEKEDVWALVQSVSFSFSIKYNTVIYNNMRCFKFDVFLFVYTITLLYY